MRRIAILLLPCLLIFLFGLHFYAKAIKSRVVVHSGEKADLIVVLTGGAGRIAEGLRLLEAKMAPKLLVTGVEASDRLHLVMPDQNLADLKRRGSLLIDPSAKNTKENAQQTRDMLAKIHPKPERLLLVSSSYHLPRVELAFQRTLPAEYQISLHAVQSQNYDPDGWWKSWRSTKLLTGEFLKYLWYSVAL